MKNSSGQQKEIRVLHIIARMNVGGPAFLIKELLTQTDNSKFESYLATGYCDINEIDYLEQENISKNVFRITGLGRRVNLFSDLLAFFKLIKLIQELKPDIIHTHTTKAGVLGRLASVLSSKRIRKVHTFHGHILFGYFNPLMTNFAKYLEKYLALISDKLIAVGTGIKKDLIRNGIGTNSKFKVIFPGLPEPVINEKKIRNLKSEFSFDGKRTVIFIGRLTKIKRPDRLIEIWKIFKANNININLLVVGDGELRPELELVTNELSLPILYLGWRSDIYELISLCNIGLLTSDNEGVPLVLIQFSQMGKPVVSTNVGSVQDIVAQNENGILTSLKAFDISEAILKISNDKNLASRYGETGRSIAKDLFSIDRMIFEHENLYLDIL
jgi:glycosyltransferase involved in cell wall biosynthesis